MNVHDHPEIKRHAAEAKAAGKCVQCRYPWYDGTCSCGMWGKAEEEISWKAAEVLAKEETLLTSELAAKSKEETARIDAALLPTEKLEGLWRDRK